MTAGVAFNQNNKREKKTNKLISFFTGIILLLSVFVAREARAQDPLEVAPGLYKLDFENDKVRVMEAHFKPGDKIAEHSHPDHFVYVLEPGKLKINHPNEVEPQEVELTKGQVVWINAETHWAENTGTTDVRLVVVELKDQKIQPHEIQPISG